MPLYSTGLLLIRAWVEKGSPKPLRAHIRTTTDVSKGFESELMVADVPSTVTTVETWLEDVLKDGQSENEGVKKISKEKKSMTTWEFKDLKGLPVVSNVEAREMGRVKEALFNPEANALFGLVVSAAEKDAPLLLIPQKWIRSIGTDAITVEGLNVAEPFEENLQAQEISAAGGYHDGMNVMTESGESVGKVDKVTLNEDGTAASYHSSTGFFGSKHDIEPSEVKSGSKDMIIISDSAREGAVKTVTGVTSEPRPRSDEAENGVSDSAREGSAKNVTG
jgi:uncharacterized protein YrrD